MENHSNYILKVRDVSVYTNLEVILKARTTNEEACKEVTRMVEGDDLFEGYEWKIEGCPKGGIRVFNDRLKAGIIERLEQEEPEDSVFWNGSKIQFELNVPHVPVQTDLSVLLKSKNREAALAEIEALRKSDNPFEGYEWTIDGCDDGGINEFNDALKNEIITHLDQESKIEDCLEVQSAP